MAQQYATGSEKTVGAALLGLRGSYPVAQHLKPLRIQRREIPPDTAYPFLPWLQGGGVRVFNQSDAEGWITRNVRKSRILGHNPFDEPFL